MNIAGKKHSITKLLLCLLLCLGGGWATGLATEHGIKDWYPTLVKPSWTPPNLLFPVIWTFLYTLMAFSLYIVWISKGDDKSKDKRMAYTAFAVQLALNFAWSYLFFYLESPIKGLIDVVFMIVAIIWTIIAFKEYSRVASYLLYPYLIWVLCAFYLNLFIWLHN